MRAAVVGRTYMLHANRGKWHYLPDGVALTLVTPAQVQHVLRSYRVELSQRWPHAVVPGWMTGRMAGFCFAPRPLWSALRDAQPDLVQVDEEPSSLALLQVLVLKRWLRCRVVFFTWENIAQPQSALARLVRSVTWRMADGAIAGSSEALHMLRQAGFRKHATVIPQLGIEEEDFKPDRDATMRSALGLTDSSFTVGYVGRLVPEKGLLTLAEALGGWQADWQWLIVGRGPLRAAIADHGNLRGVGERIIWVDTVPHREVARHLNTMDVLVLASVSTARWKEQFGHVLIEAMACGVPVIGSDSGAIPEVIGNVGLTFPEGDPEALRARLASLQQDVVLRTTLGQEGRTRVMERYTNRHIAQQTAAFWQEVADASDPVP